MSRRCGDAGASPGSSTRARRAPSSCPAPCMLSLRRSGCAGMRAAHHAARVPARRAALRRRTDQGAHAIASGVTRWRASRRSSRVAECATALCGLAELAHAVEHLHACDEEPSPRVLCLDDAGAELLAHDLPLLDGALDA